MVRGLALPVVVFIHTAGCSLILDFSNKAIPIDAAIDAPYTDVECMYKEPNDTVDTASVVPLSAASSGSGEAPRLARQGLFSRSRG